MQKATSMDETRGKAQDLVRNHLKVLLLHLAARSENPGLELQALLREVIEELHAEVKSSLKAKCHLRVVDLPADSSV